MQGSLTGNVLSAPASAAPTDDPNSLDKLFAQMEEALKMQGASNQQVINTMGVGQQAAIAATAPPAPQAVPATMSGPARAMATFGAGMGSSLTRNPAMLANMQNQIAAQDENAAAVERSNYATQAAYDKDKQGTLLSHQVKLLELKAEEQIKMGDRDGALQSLKMQTAIAEKLRKQHLEDDTKSKDIVAGNKLNDALKLITARGDNAIRVQKAKDAALTHGMDKASLAEYAQRAASMRESAKVQLEDLATMMGGPGANSEEGNAKIKEIQAQLDTDLRNLANEIRRVAAPPTALVTPSSTPPTGISVDAEGVPTDPIRRAYWLKTHPKP